jgi:ribonuclease HII
MAKIVKLNKETSKVAVHEFAPQLPVKIKWLIGIDEVGRGPLAGPVGIGICAIPFVKNISNSYKEFIKKNSKILKERSLVFKTGRDSKKMSEKERGEWYEFLNAGSSQSSARADTQPGVVCVLDFYINYKSESAKMIDQKGISVCIKDSINFLLKKFVDDMNLSAGECMVLLDGSLKAGELFSNQKTIVKGDEKHMVIGLASIYAKVIRDDFMKKISRKDKYTKYSFGIHKGYGTAHHRLVISQCGISDLHRKSYCRNINKSA